MPQATNLGTQIKCSFGAAPMPLVANNAPTVMIGNKPAGTIMDFTPMKNIPPFGLCNSPSNPLGMGMPPPGVPKPCPCVPIVTGPWSPGSAKVMIGNKPALRSGDMAMCTWAGQISVVMGVPTVDIK